MTIGLIKKDMILLKKRMLIIYFTSLSFFIGLGMALKDSGFESLAIIISSLFLAYFYIGNIYEIEGRNGAECLLIASPYERKSIIDNKYIFAVGLLIVYYVICFIVVLLVMPLKKTCHELSFQGIAYSFVLVCMLYAFFIPFFTKYDYIKARNVLVLFTMVFSTAVIMVFSYVEKKIISVNLSLLKWDSTLMSIGLILVGGISLYISYKISLTIYKHKQF